MLRTLCVCSATSVAVIAAIIAVQIARLPADRPFVIMPEHSATTLPPAHATRFRLPLVREHLGPKDDFFHWWNFLVTDADTGRHWNFMYTLKDHHGINADNEDDPAKRIFMGEVMFADMHGADMRHGAAARFSERRVDVANDFDVVMRGGPRADAVQSMRVLNDGATYVLDGELEDLEWHLTLERTHGCIHDLHKEDPSFCFIMSSLFGYNSVASGYIVSKGQRFDIAKTSRFRAYAASSWGCTVPNGSPAHEHPWTWFWLVFPGDTPADDIGLVGGTGRFGSMAGALNGGYAIIDSKPGLLADDGHYSIRYARLLDGSPLEFYMSGSASDGYFSNFTVEQSNWHTERDHLGDALIPLTQSFVFASAKYKARITFTAKPGQYNRCPVVVTGRLYSDYRAVNVHAHLLVELRHPEPGQNAVVIDRETNTHNAVEFAYEAPVGQEAYDEFESQFVLVE